MNILKITSFIFLILFGIFLVLFGGYDDSPGAQGLGLVIATIGAILSFKQITKKI